MYGYFHIHKNPTDEEGFQGMSINRERSANLMVFGVFVRFDIEADLRTRKRWPNSRAAQPSNIHEGNGASI